MEVVTFYNMFYGSPGGRHHAYVCTNLPLLAAGSGCPQSAARARVAPRDPQRARPPPMSASPWGTRSVWAPARMHPCCESTTTYHEDLDVEEAKKILDALE